MSVESLNDLFFDSFRKYRNNLAVVYNNGDITAKIKYFELAEESDKVSKCLREVHAEGYIGIFMEHELSLPSVILGVLREGLPFVFINANDTSEDDPYLLNCLYLQWVFFKKTSHGKNMQILSKCGRFVRNINVFSGVLELWNIPERTKKLLYSTDMKIAYAIQTSGSTGEPKLVQVPHKSIVPNVLDLRKILDVTEHSIIFLGSPMTFDPSLIELFLPFTCGATLLIVPSHIRASPALLLEILFPRSHEDYLGITILQMTPSVFSRWSLSDLQRRVLSNTSTLKSLVLGGEPCPNKTVLKQWKDEKNETKIFNIYGITEVSCWATIHQIDFSCSSDSNEISDGIVPLGTPLSHTLLEVRNDDGSRINDGEGELFIGSKERICIIDNEPAESLCPPVFRATGDIVKVDSQSGHMKFVSRKNRLVKRFGHRVSLTAVENISGSHPGVELCACVWNEDQHMLGLAVMWKEDEDREFKSYLLQHLSKFYVPDIVVPVKSLPLTCHGKVDLEALHQIVFQEAGRQEKGLVKITSFHSAFAEMWQQTLGQKPELHDDFLSAGGNSFLALQLVLKLSETTEQVIPNKVMSMLLTGSTFEEIYKYLLNFEELLKDNGAVESSGRNEIPKESGNTDNQSVSPQKRKELKHKKMLMKKSKSETSPALFHLQSDQVLVFENELIATSCRGKSTFFQTNGDVELWNKIKLPVNFTLLWKYNFLKCVDASPCFLKFKRLL